MAYGNQGLTSSTHLMALTILYLQRKPQHTGMQQHDAPWPPQASNHEMTVRGIHTLMKQMQPAWLKCRVVPVWYGICAGLHISVKPVPSIKPLLLWHYRWALEPCNFLCTKVKGTHTTVLHSIYTAETVSAITHHLSVYQQSGNHQMTLPEKHVRSVQCQVA